LVVRTIIAFFVGMTLLALTLVVVESVWVVALVGVAHITGSVVLGVLVVRQLSREEGEEGGEDPALAPGGAGQPH
jgi:hypothetical protein